MREGADNAPFMNLYRAQISGKQPLHFLISFVTISIHGFALCDNGKGVFMTKEQFMEQVTEEIRQKSSQVDLDISCGIFLKNNDTTRHGIVLKKRDAVPGRIIIFQKNNDTTRHGIVLKKRDEFISPTVYVDGFYQDFLRKKKTIPEVAQKVLEALEKVKEHAELYQDFSVEFEDCRDKIIYRLISYDRNRNYLETVPYLPFLNLAIVFNVVCNISGHGLETITVTNELLDKWDTSTRELIRLAEENTPRLLPVTMDSLTSILTKYIGITNDIESSADSSSQMPMILVSNQSGVNGSAVMLYPGVIHRLACQYESNLFILPSSIHEIIAVPDLYCGTGKELSRMVQDINQNHVGEEEVLADTAYYYDRTEKKFSYEQD